MDMQGLIEEMSGLIAKIKSGEATRGEIEAFAAASAELHERAVVLRYKYYEAKVHNTVVEAVAAVPSTLEARGQAEVELVDTTPELAPEPVAELVIEEPSAEFDLFEEPQVEEVADVLETQEEIVEEREAAIEEGSFDLFSMDEEEEEEEPAFSFDAPADEVVAVSEPEVESPSMEEELTVVEADEAPIHSLRSGVWSAPENTDEPEASEEDREAALEEESFIIEDESVSLLEEGLGEVTTEEDRSFVAETPAMEEPVTEEMDFTSPEPVAAPAPEIDLASSYQMHPVYHRLNSEDNSIAGRLMAVRLESLNGAFGFNERMQIVQELFNGSNDLFTQAITELDNMPSKDAARGKVSKIATIYGWSADNRLALEFVQKVERRYA